MLYFIGYNHSGEFGDGHTNTVKQLSAPNWNQNIHHDITQIYNGYGFSIYKDSNNIFYSAGDNKYGSCIQEKKENKIIKARNIQSLQGMAIKSIFCNPVHGSYHGFVLTKNNKLFGFGKNKEGQLGDGTTSNKYTLSDITFNHGIIKDIKCSMYYSLLLTMSGKVYSTDYSTHGGNGQEVKKKNGSKRWNCIEWTDGWFKKETHQLQNISKIATGNGHSLCLDSNGNVFSFGYNYWGQLGLGSSDYNPHSKPTVIPFKISVIDICCGNYHSIVLGKDGNIYTFGDNRCGECGHGSANREDKITRPTKVNGLKDIKIKEILCGSNHSAAITANNEIYLFGYNKYNQCIISTYDPYKDNPILINKYIEQRYKKEVSAITLGCLNTKILLSCNKNEANIEEKEFKQEEESEIKEEMDKDALFKTNKWNCNICTFANENNNKICLMCNEGIKTMEMRQEKKEEEKKERKEERNDVHIWLQQVVKLPEYYKLFEENGFETMIIIPSMTEQHLKEIGIKKAGHRMKIMVFINEMKNNKPKVEERKEEKERGNNSVQEWLTKTVGLGEYFNNFIEDGYDDMITITNSMNEQDLIDMGINKKGHRKKIIIFIQKYKNEHLNQNNINIDLQQYAQIEGDKQAIVAPNLQDTDK